MRNTEREGLIRFLVPIFLCLPHHLEIHKVSYEGGEGGEGGGGGVPGRALRGQQELAPAPPGTHLQVKNWIIVEPIIFKLMQELHHDDSANYRRDRPRDV